MTSSQPQDPWIGRAIGDRARYRLDQRVGAGGMGDVFLATDVLLGQPVALKLLKERLAVGDLRKRFEREVALCVALQSVHIVQVMDYGVTPEGNPFYVMEYLRGQTLRQILHYEGQLSVERTHNIITQVCAGLHLAHQGVNLPTSSTSSSTPSGEHVKVIHRDLKPDNIFLVPTALGELVKVLDFGIAKIRGDQAEHSHATSMFLGTYRYAAPEQLEMEKDLDERADIYSLGIILYEMLSGTDPFGFGFMAGRVSGVTWAVAHCSKPVIPLRQQPRCDHVPPDLEAVVMQCLEKSPERRFSSAIELKAALHLAVPHVIDRPPSAVHSTDESSTSAPLQAFQFLSPTAFDSAIGSPEETITLRFETSADSTSKASVESKKVENKKIEEPGSQERQTEKSRIKKSNDEHHSASMTIVRSLKPPPQFVPIWQQPLLLAGASLTTTVALALGAYYWVQASAPSTTNEPVIQSVGVPVPASPTEPAPLAESSAAQSWLGHVDTVWAVATSPTEPRIASGGFDRVIKLWNSETGELVRTLTGHTDGVRAVAFSPDGQFVVSGSSDETINIWNAETGELRRTLPGHSGPVWSVAISPDGRTIASGSYDGTVKIWDLQTGMLLRTLPEHYDSVWSVTISPDGRTIASGSYDGTVKIWDLQTGALIRTLSSHAEAVRSVAISPNGQFLASASWDKTVKIWNLQTGALVHTLTGHTDRVITVAISPSGETVASGSLDDTIILWDLKTGAPLRTLVGHQDWVVSIAFAPKGNTLVSGGKDRMIKQWNVPAN